MIGAVRTPAQQLVTVFGGSGFLGRHVVQALANAATGSASPRAGLISPCFSSRWAPSGRSTRCRRICAIPDRSLTRSRRPTT